MSELAETYLYDLENDGHQPDDSAARAVSTVLAGLITDSRPRLELPEGLPFEAWLMLGEHLMAAERNLLWLIGDWLNFGEAHYPDRYSQALEATHYRYSTLTNAAYVARAIPPAGRKESVPFAYHAEVAALPEAERAELLDQAERGEISNRYQMRALARRVTADGGGKPLAAATCRRCGSPCSECAE